MRGYTYCGIEREEMKARQLNGGRNKLRQRKKQMEAGGEKMSRVPGEVPEVGRRCDGGGWECGEGKERLEKGG